MNPGIPNRNLAKHTIELKSSNIKLTSQQYCSDCKVIIEEKTKHCEDCQICIEDYDHHCPWIGKCIGKGNLLYFNWFLGSTLLLALHAIISTLSLV